MGNSISFTGRVAGEGEVRQAGKSNVLNFRMASDVGFGERKTTNWFNMQVWGARAEKLAPHIEKGKLIFVTGELCLRKYKTKEGVERDSADVNVNTLDFISTGSKGGDAPAPSSDEPGDDMPF